MVVGAPHAEEMTDVALRIGIDQEHPLARRRASRRQLNGRGGLADPALHVDDGDSPHESSPDNRLRLAVIGALSRE